MHETELYAPVKRFLELQGYEVKGEVGAADIVALKADHEPVIVELKTGFTLALFHQAIARQALSDVVYIAGPSGEGGAFHRALKSNIGLCRRLGLGLLTVRITDGSVCAHLDPAPYAPRKSKARRGRLLAEFSRRVGDPNSGGSTRQPVMTAYRQDALRCIAHLLSSGPDKASRVAASTGVTRARQLMADDHYGWFERIATGIYQLSPKGLAAAQDHGAEIARLRPDPAAAHRSPVLTAA